MQRWCATFHNSIAGDGLLTSGLAPDFMPMISGRPDIALSMAVGTLRPLALVSGELYTAKDENGELVGFTAWTPPGRSSFDT